ncbi:snoRNP protein GAR1 [Halomicrobium zhouii]|uniref:snoRNP protein GAR1 n=1 Tax=Halomicrobium zhouii TaxID=767519 RepID=A0A1I6LJK5_9EURY|nr:Gar1/Naf1 family protein [Halomicrobium zhouii]SFS03707.1 snoRNP protein GAR1 [Halomicrobium zhouii]
MKRVGDVVRVAQGLAVARCPDRDHPDIGRAVLTDDLEDAGRVVDVFGPVERPYVAVTPDDDVRLATLVGKPLYAR